MSSNFLPEIDLNEAIDTHTNGLLKAAQERYVTVTGRAHAGLKKLAYKAAGLHDDETDATNAAADLLERFSESIEVNGDNIVANIAQSSAGTATQAAQVLELEGRISDAERQLAEAHQIQEDLQRSAMRASNLQASLDQKDAENARLKRELAASQAEAQELKDNANKPNPLKVRVDQLESENSTIKAENSDLKEKLERADADKAEVIEAKVKLQQQLDTIREGLGEAKQLLNEPDDPSDKEELADGSSPQGDDKQRGRRSWLPGHRRNQGGEA